ncbi:MAG: hypothetical protein JRH20_18085 [Deltaproteobacteria bacterium]|nr:hypothetical protein [Deltaproteobacteria bacterium]
MTQNDASGFIRALSCALLLSGCSSSTPPQEDAAMETAAQHDAQRNDQATASEGGALNEAGSSEAGSDLLADSSVQPSTGALRWAKAAGSDSAQAATDVASLVGGGSVVVGRFEDDVTFGAGEPGAIGLSLGEAVQGTFIARYDGVGRVIWAKAGQVNAGTAPVVTVTTDGGFVMAGLCRDGAAIGTVALPVCQAFIARYLDDGSLVWAKALKATAAPYRSNLAIAADTTGGFYLAGRTDRSFVAHYDKSGAEDWVRAVGASSYVFPRLAAHAEGTVTVVGGFEGTMTLGEGEPEETTLTSVGDNDLFVARYASSGVLLHAQRVAVDDMPYRGVSLPGRVYSMDVTSAPNGGSVLAGTYSGIVTFGPGHPAETKIQSENTVPFAVYFKADGAPGWAQTYPSPTGEIENVRAVAVDADGSIRMAGDWDSNGKAGAFLASYEESGVVQWEHRMNAVGSIGYSVALGQGGSTTMVGQFWNTTVFGENETNETTLISPAGQPSIFLARYD